MALLEVKDLHTSFFTDAGEVRAVNGVPFDLERGKVLGIVGESDPKIGDGLFHHADPDIDRPDCLLLHQVTGELGADENVMKSIRGNKISIISRSHDQP